MATHAGFSRHIVIALPRLAVLQHGDQFFATSVGQGWAPFPPRPATPREARLPRKVLIMLLRKPALTGNNAASALDHGAGIDGSVGTLAKDYLRNASM